MDRDVAGFGCLMGLCCFLLLVIIPISGTGGVGKKGHRSSRSEREFRQIRIQANEVLKVRTRVREPVYGDFNYYSGNSRDFFLSVFAGCLCFIDIIHSTNSYAFALAGDYWLAGLSLLYLITGWGMILFHSVLSRR